MWLASPGARNDERSDLAMKKHCFLIEFLTKKT